MQLSLSFPLVKTGAHCGYDGKPLVAVVGTARSECIECGR
jgi:hypothetical protein